MKKSLALALVCLFVFAAAIPCTALDDTSVSPGSGIVIFGTYPQSRVTNAQELQKLNASLSDATEWHGIRLANGTAAQTADVTLKSGTYRAVKQGNSIAWFRFEPLTWHEQNLSDGVSVLVCDTIIAAEKDADGTLYALQRQIYDVAFTPAEKAHIADVSMALGSDDAVYVFLPDEVRSRVPKSAYAAYTGSAAGAYTKSTFAVKQQTRTQTVPVINVQPSIVITQDPVSNYRPGWLINLLRLIIPHH